MSYEPKARRGATVELDRERRLRYNLAAVDEIQDKYGVDLVAGDPLAFQGVDDIAWLVWVGLKHAGEEAPWNPSLWNRLLVWLGFKERPELDVEHVKAWIDMQNVVRVGEAIYDALGQGAAEQETVEELDPTTQRETAPQAAKAADSG